MDPVPLMAQPLVVLVPLEAQVLHFIGVEYAVNFSSALIGSGSVGGSSTVSGSTAGGSSTVGGSTVGGSSTVSGSDDSGMVTISFI